MKSVWYIEPSGERVFEPSAETVLELMRLGSDDYWGPYSPVGVLEWHEHWQWEVLARAPDAQTARKQLLFIRHPELGWYSEYSTTNLPDRRWLVPLDPDSDRDSFVRHWAFGEQLYFLTGCFLPQTVAEQVVRDFLATEEPSPATSWVGFENIWPRLDPYEYRKRRRERGSA